MSGFSSKQLGEQHLRPLPAAQVVNVAIESDIAETETAGDFLDFGIDHVEVVARQECPGSFRLPRAIARALRA